MQIFSPNESKAWSEKFNLVCALIWIPFFSWVVISKHYETASPWGWIMYGLVIASVHVVIPPLVPGKVDSQMSITERHWFKANLWMAIFGFVGNYFWTHYFYSVLGAAYTMNTYRINGIPYTMFFCTQAYFMFYHSLTNVILRIFQNLWPKKSTTRLMIQCLLIITIALVTAFMETFTLHNFPYYTHKDKYRMYTQGSIFYALYFIVSFPMFYRMEEEPGEKWHLSKVAIDSFGAAMIVTCLLDFWRLGLGSIVPVDGGALRTGIPFLQ